MHSDSRGYLQRSTSPPKTTDGTERLSRLVPIYGEEGKGEHNYNRMIDDQIASVNPDAPTMQTRARRERAAIATSSTKSSNTARGGIDGIKGSTKNDTVDDDVRRAARQKTLRHLSESIQEKELSTIATTLGTEQIRMDMSTAARARGCTARRSRSSFINVREDAPIMSAIIPSSMHAPVGNRLDSHSLFLSSYPNRTTTLSPQTREGVKMCLRARRLFPPSASSQEPNPPRPLRDDRVRGQICKTPGVSENNIADRDYIALWMAIERARRIHSPYSRNLKCSAYNSKLPIMEDEDSDDVTVQPTHSTRKVRQTVPRIPLPRSQAIESASMRRLHMSVAPSILSPSTVSSNSNNNATVSDRGSTAVKAIPVVPRSALKVKDSEICLVARPASRKRETIDRERTPVVNWITEPGTLRLVEEDVETQPSLSSELSHNWSSVQRLHPNSSRWFHSSPFSEAEATLRRLLSKLSRLNLTHLVDRNSLRFRSSGGCSDIYMGLLHLKGSPIRIAVKRIRFNIRTDPKFARKLTREIRVWSKLHHSNVLPLLGFMLEAEVVPLIITPWMENGTVLDFVKERPSIDISPLVNGIASGLDYLHSSGIVHADLKSDNIVVSPRHQPLLMDFGISHLLMSASTFETATSAEKGSARWMAIELLLGTGESVPEDDVHTMMSDVWAFGMTVLELLTKRRPYHHLRTDVQVMFAISSYTLPSPPEVESWDDRYLYLWEVCRRCWARAPLGRPSMTDLSQEIAKLVTV